MRRHLQSRISQSLFAGVLALAVFVVGHNLYFLLKYATLQKQTLSWGHTAGAGQDRRR